MIETYYLKTIFVSGYFAYYDFSIILCIASASSVFGLNVVIIIISIMLSMLFLVSQHDQNHI